MEGTTVVSFRIEHGVVCLSNLAGEIEPNSRKSLYYGFLYFVLLVVTQKLESMNSNKRWKEEDVDWIEELWTRVE